MSKLIALRIDKMQDGGFIVGEAWRGDANYAQGPTFACTDIDEALAYVKRNLNPPVERPSFSVNI